MRLLLVEDAVKIASFIKDGLKQEGFAVDYADNAEDGPYLALTEPYGLAVVGHMLPGTEGLTLTTELPLDHVQLRARCRDNLRMGPRISSEPAFHAGISSNIIKCKVYVSFP